MKCYNFLCGYQADQDDGTNCWRFAQEEIRKCEQRKAYNRIANNLCRDDDCKFNPGAQFMKEREKARKACS